jgi:hypothetical protein
MAAASRTHEPSHRSLLLVTPYCISTWRRTPQMGETENIFSSPRESRDPQTSQCPRTYRGDLSAREYLVTKRRQRVGMAPISHSLAEIFGSLMLDHCRHTIMLAGSISMSRAFAVARIPLTFFARNDPRPLQRRSESEKISLHLAQCCVIFAS